MCDAYGEEVKQDLMESHSAVRKGRRSHIQALGMELLLVISHHVASLIFLLASNHEQVAGASQTWFLPF